MVNEMLNLKSGAVLMCVLGLVGCGSTYGGGSKAQGKAQIDGYSVSWGAISALKDRVPQGLTPLMFRYSSLGGAPSNGVTQQDWEREAQKWGMGVSDLKSTVFGGSAYKGPDGALRVCTISAIQRGLCGKKLGLSVARRVAYAERIITQSGQCRWVGFDPSYNARTARSLGAEDFSLHVAADCR